MEYQMRRAEGFDQMNQTDVVASITWDKGGFYIVTVYPMKGINGGPNWFKNVFGEMSLANRSYLRQCKNYSLTETFNIKNKTSQNDND